MPHPTSRARRFPTANVTNLPGGTTNAAAGGIVAPRSATVPAPRFPGTGLPPSRGTGLGGELPVQPPVALPALGQFRAVTAPRPPQAASFGSNDPRIQALIDQIARSTQGGATTGSSFRADPRIEQLVGQLSSPGDPASFVDTGQQQRALLQALIAQISGGQFDFNASTDPEARAFRVAQERARAEAQVGISERRAADPTNTGGFDVDTRALRARTGESIARFAAGRASQRRGEVLGERIGGANAALSSLGLAQSGDVSRFNADLASREQGLNQQVAALQAALNADVSRRGSFESEQARALSRTQGTQASQQALLQSLLAEQSRVQGGQAAAGQQVFANELSSAQFESRQGGAAQQAQQAQLARALQQQQIQQQLRRDAIAEQQARQDEEFRRREEERANQDRRDQRRRGEATELERQRRQIHQAHGHDHG